MRRPKLRDNRNKGPYEPYPLGQIPDDVIYNIAKGMTYYFAIGRADIGGDDWGDIFANAVGGEHLGKPIGLADVIYKGMAWSVKSVKDNRPWEKKTVRLISGRNSPDYSFKVDNPHANVQKTGDMALSIWNERVNIARERYEPLRTCVLLRNPLTMRFALFEKETLRYDVSDFEWRENKNGNFEGYHKSTEKHCFTWQPSGSQFTIICDVPSSAKRFQIKRPPMLDFEETMRQIGFDKEWVLIQ
ncbi:MAG: hypothetical protein IJR54_04730 [Oscillibacter sp.]|nr:hypothetical protein [Oscillibacter sp.]